MKVLIIENIHSEIINGGIPVYIKNLINANQEIDFTLLGTGKVRHWLHSNYESLTVKKIGHVTYLLYAFIYIVKNSLYKKFDIVHFHRYDTASLGFLFNFFSNAEVYTTLHGDHLNSLRSKKSRPRQYIYKIMALIGRNFTDTVVLVSSKFTYMVDKGKNYKVIPVGIDMSSYGEIENKNTYPVKFIYVGRIDKEKGVNFIIEQFKKSSKKSELLIIGDGPLLEFLKAEYNNEKNIKFLGFISLDQLHRYYNLSHCLLLASEFEASPTVVREALYFKCNVISLDVGDLSNVFYNLNCIQIVDKNKFLDSLNTFSYREDCFSKLKHQLIDSSILYNGYYISEK